MTRSCCILDFCGSPIHFLTRFRPPLTTQCARASAILTQISGNEKVLPEIIHESQCVRWPRRDFRLRTSDFGLPTSDFRLRTSDFGLQTSDFRLQTSDFRLRTSDFGLSTSDFRLRTSDFRLQTSDFGLPTSDFRLSYN